MHPRFSIIVSVYKVAPYLRACLDSICNQTFHDWEAICVDDGSPDESGKILDEYAASDSRFKVVHQENKGVGAARNVGLEAAVGDWLWVIDGDDMIVPKALQLLDKAISDFQHRGLHSILIGNEQITNEMKPIGEGSISSSRYFDKATSGLTCQFFSAAWSKIFKRSDVGGVRFWNCRYNEDAAFVLDYEFRGRGWLVLDAKLYSYRKRPGSTTCSRLSKESMALIFETEDWLFDKALDAQRIMPDAEMDALFRIMHLRTFYTFEGGYFKLSSAERKELLPKWLTIQRRYVQTYQVSPKIRMCVFLAGLFNSGLLVKYIVLGLQRLNLLLHRILMLG